MEYELIELFLVCVLMVEWFFDEVSLNLFGWWIVGSFYMCICVICFNGFNMIFERDISLYFVVVCMLFL